MDERHIKPPIGVLNRENYEIFLTEDVVRNGGMSLRVVKTERLNNLKGAIERYAEAKRHIDTEWVQEYNELLSELGVKKIEFKL